MSPSRTFRLLLRLAILMLGTDIALGAHAEDAPPSARVEARGSTIEFEGSIDEQSARAFETLARLGHTHRLVITSGGGDVASGIAMARTVFELGFDVEAPSDCHSSCANYVFPAGRRKIIGSLGAVSWHGNMAHVLYLERSEPGRWGSKSIDSARALAESEHAFFASIGVDGFVCWFAKLDPYGAPDFYSLGVRDMEHFGISNVEINATVEAPGEAPREASRPAFAALPIQVDWDALPELRARAAR